MQTLASRPCEVFLTNFSPLENLPRDQGERVHGFLLNF